MARWASLFSPPAVCGGGGKSALGGLHGWLPVEGGWRGVEEGHKAVQGATAHRGSYCSMSAPGAVW
eukprot:7233447-Pyramimonas_sp.AAC.1